MLPYHLDIAVQYGVFVLKLFFHAMENDFRMITFLETKPLPRHPRFRAAFLAAA
jgi:hypothetical protein